MPIAMSSADRPRGRVRFTIVAMLFAITMVNYADRATLAITGPVISKDLGFTHVQMGFIFSAFGSSYVLGQLKRMELKPQAQLDRPPLPVCTST